MVQTPLVLVYHSDILPKDDGAVLEIWHNVITAYEVMALLCTLAAARESAVVVSCIDTRMASNGWDFLLFL